VLHCEGGVAEAKGEYMGVRHHMDGNRTCLHCYVPQGIMYASHGRGEGRAFKFPGPTMARLETGKALVCSYVRRKVPGDVVGAPIKVGYARFRAAHDSKGHERRVVRGRESLAPKGLMDSCCSPAAVRR
jgi:hypothetical protein